MRLQNYRLNPDLKTPRVDLERKRARGKNSLRCSKNLSSANIENTDWMGRCIRHVKIQAREI